MANVLAKRAARVLSGTRRMVSRRLYFAPDKDRDIFLASYPRSGNTWIRAIIYPVLNGTGPASLGAINELVPDSYLRLPRREVVPRPFYVVKTHEPFRGEAVRRAIYILREPKAVFRSHLGYMQANTRGNHDPLRLAGDWARGRAWPCSWNEHATTWLDSNRQGEIMLVEYEELKSNPVLGIRAMAAFIGSPVSAARAGEISRQTSMADMMRLENNGMGRQSEKRLIATGAGTLPPEVSGLIDAACGRVWSTFGGRGNHGVVSHPDGSRRVFSAAEGVFVPE